MATVTIQSTDTDLLTALGGTTADGDSVYIDRYSVNYTGADLSGSSRDLALVEVTPGYAGLIGSGAGGAQIKCVCNRTSTGIFRNRSRSGRIELISTSAAGVIYNVVNDPETGGVLDVNTCAVENLYAIGGSTYVQSACDMEQAYCYPGAYLKLAYATYILDYVYGRGGKMVIERDFAAADIEGDCEATINDVRVTPGTSITMKGGLAIIKRMGPCQLLNGGSGMVDFTQLETPVAFNNRLCEPGVILKFTRKTYSLVTFTATTGESVAGGPQILFA